MSTLNYFNYYTEIEEHFVKRRGKHLLVSPLDWSLIEVWKESGIPLNVALRGIDRAFDHYEARPIKPRLVNSLFYCHQEVLTAFAEHKEAYVGAGPAERAAVAAGLDGAESPPPQETERDKLTRLLHAKIADLERGREKALAETRSRSAEAIARAIERLRELLTEIADPALGVLPYESIEKDLSILDKLLVDAALSEVPDAARQEWQQEAKYELKIYKKNLTKETYERIVENFINKKAHLHFDLPILSLFFL